jgi:hypothetical protein
MLLTEKEVKDIGEKCLAVYSIDKSKLMLELHERYQSGVSTYANPKYVELPYDRIMVYFNVEGHYAQAIFLKCSLDKQTWVTLHGESDH